jgi:tyrosine decarboxylase/aspartate 1-decarboxylase
MKHLGREGYMRIVKNCMHLTLMLAEEIPKIRDLTVVAPPTMNVVGLKSQTFDIGRIAQELRRRKWAVSLFPHHIRIVIMPHVHQEHVVKFLEDLKQVVRELRG